MRTDSVELEEERLKDINTVDAYRMIHERHRIFPAVFEGRDHKNILDLSAGVGVVAKRINDIYCSQHQDCNILCNDQSPTCLRILNDNGLDIISFDLDDASEDFPLTDGSLDAIICLSTIEHLINTEHFIDEVRRVLSDDGRLYLSAPNYSGLTYLLPFLWSGKTFHDPMAAESRYEFYAHVRYFTYRTLCDLTCLHGFEVDTVYIGAPKDGSRFKDLDSKSHLAALTYKSLIKLVYEFSSPRWASEPVICFRKSDTGNNRSKPRKIVL